MAVRFQRLAPDARAKEILAAAREVFARTGYAQVSIGDIASEAGVTRGLVHHYFGGKREVYLAVVTDLMERAQDAIRTDHGLESEAALAANTDAWLDFLEEDAELARAVVGAADLGDPEITDALDRAREGIVDRVLINRTGTADHPEAVRLVVRAFLGMAEAASREWLGRGRATRAQVHALLVAALLALVRDALPAVLAADG